MIPFGYGLMMAYAATDSLLAIGQEAINLRDWEHLDTPVNARAQWPINNN